MNQTGKSDTVRIPFYNVLILLFRLLGICTFIVIVIFLIPLAIPYIKNALSFHYIRVALEVERSISSFVQSIIPTKVANYDLTRWIVIVCALILGGFFSRTQQRFRDKIANLRVKIDYEEWKSKMQLSDDAKVLGPLKGKLEGLKTSNKKDREELLKVFAETKKKLDEMGRDLAFLAIDVVDSTGLKLGEEKAAVEHDFKEYKLFVDSKLSSNGALKSAWTPDGVMSCFPTVDAAVRAARDVITGLEPFNKHVKTMRKDFKVRCGINEGYVYFDESIPLEEISDRVIDIAGHMQKHALPNTICIAKPAIEPTKERGGFVPAGRVVDGYEVYVWERE
jgi:class 3 adenylate cyclase